MKAFRLLFHRLLAILILALGLAAGSGRALAQRPIGIDVSDFQSASIDWGTLKNTYGISFGWAKASEGTHSGSGYGGGNFPTYATNAKGAGVLIGAYHFARYDSNPGVAGAMAEANVFWAATKNYIKADGLSLMPMLDVEASFTGQTKATVSQWVNTWCTTVSNNASAVGLKVKPCVYISSSSSSTYLDSTVTQWNTDIANWPYAHASAASSAQAASSPPAGIAPWTGWQFWQYDDQNVAQAITTGDGDIFNGTLAQLNATMVITTNSPAIPQQPASITVVPGTNATFSVTAIGSGTIHYQWQFNQANIPGATASSFNINNVQLANAGAYSVLLTDSLGTVPSHLAYLSVQSFLTNAPGSIVAPSGMVNWWPGDGNLIDIFGTANGTPQGGLNYAPGERGLAVHLDGLTGVITNNAASLAVPWTACMWVNRQNSLQTSAGLLEDGTYALKLEQYNGTRQVGLTVSGVGDFVFSPAYTVPTGTWTHLAFVGTSTGTTLYTNGVFAASLTNSIPLPRKYIGGAYISSSVRYVDFLLGSLDEIMAFNRALNPTEINSIYSAGAAGLVHAPEVVSSQLTGPSQFTLRLRGQTGRNYTIYSSTDLINWVNLGALGNTLGTNQFIDNSVSANSQKFYRVSQPY